jgi:sterol desaturase/sphingolipid hydroxylase (fatty acid hydroxylase superfamily)
VHHHRIRQDTDSNYSTVLSLWDRLFGSRSPTRRTPEMEIGVEGREEQDLPGLLARPFRLRGTAASAG